jgi:hypothetical protein
MTVDDVDDLYLFGLLYDVPSSVGDSIFVREARLSLEGEPIEEPQPHLYSVGGFLDDTWWHRYYMLYGTRFKNGPGGGLGRSGGAPYGRLLVYDTQRVYGYGEARPNSYHLFCMNKGGGGPSTLAPTDAGSQQRRRTAAPAAIWSNPKFPILARALVMDLPTKTIPAETAGRLVVAGPPAAAQSSFSILRGAEGGLLAVVDAATGERISQISINSPPVFDGMCAARGHIVLSTDSGEVVALQ